MTEHTISFILWFLIGCGLTYGFHLIMSSFKNSLEVYSQLQEERYRVIKSEVEDLNECYQKFLVDFKELLLQEQERRRKDNELGRNNDEMEER